MPDATAFPATLDADLQDQVIRICAELDCAGPILMVLSFPVRLDPVRLARAARLVLDAEPIVGCRFESHPRRPVWRRRDDLDDVDWCVVHSTDDPDELIRSLLVPRPEHLEQTFLVHLVHCPAGDMVLIWMSHLIADGSAAGECAGLLASIYSRLASDPGYTPEVNREPRDGLLWMADLTARDVLRIVRRDIVDAWQARGRVHGFQRDYESFRAAPRTGAAFVKHRIAPTDVAAIDRFAAARRCTRNDLLTTAMIRAFREFAWQGPAAKTRVGLTVNLRTYAPPRRRYPLCSMVGITWVSVGPDLGAAFDDTLAAVTKVIRRQKKAFMGAANPLFVRVMAAMSFQRKRGFVVGQLRRMVGPPTPPTFSNGGRIPAAKLRFDGVAPDEAGYVVYPSALPMFLVTALEYQGAVTLTACFQPADLSVDRVKAFLEQMAREIPYDTAGQPAALVKEIA